MSSTVVFATNSHGGATKKRKRMPGTNHVSKPEIKQINWFLADSTSEANRLNFGASTFYSSAAATLTNDLLFWRIIPLPFPIASASVGRVGVKIQYLYARFKGYLHVSHCCNQDIRWRMVLYRTADVDLDTTNQNDAWSELYLNMQSVTNTDAAASYTNWQHNFYKKVWNVRAESWCKHKVIASGVVPRVFKADKQKLFAVGSGTQYQLGLIWDNNEEPYGALNIPIDTKVKLHDNVDNTVKYYISFESDCPIGWYVSTDGANITPSAASGVNPFSISIFSRLYYLDN